MLKGYKTYIVAGTAIVTAIGAYLYGGIDLPTMVQSIVGAILAMTVRQGITTEAQK